LTTAAPTPSLSYAPIPGCYDDMVGADGLPRPEWRHLAGALAELGVDELRRRSDEAAHLLDQDGVTYNAYPDETAGSHRWRLDPMPVLISSHDWETLETGIIERAELLNLILEDLYGPRDLLRRGLIPPEIIFGHSGFLRPCDGIRLPCTQQLFSYAADIVRDTDGRCAVVADRTQAPSGFGYALENRTVISRVFPTLYRDAHVHRVAPFFRSLRVALQDAAPPTVDDPRIVVLTPGPWNETAFEHAFLASYLGYPLVEGSDLSVRDGRVFLRALGRLEPVDVILRRVDGWYCDPLELKPDSQLGVPGLVEATHAGAVSVVNTLGSSVLENAALLPLLPRLSDHLLGRPLALPSVPTWWCGEDAGRSHVLANLQYLVLRHISRGEGPTARFGWELSAGELDEVRAAITARPYEWTGQEPPAMAGTPTLTAGGVEARRGLLRAYAVARKDSYVVMPGGLTRVAPDAEVSRISNQAGAISKDTWVLASEPERLTGFWLQEGPAVEAADPMASIPSRAAENLWWLGRYAERAEDTTRLLRAVYDRRNDFQGSANPAGIDALQALLVALTRTTTTWPGFDGDGAAERLRSPGRELFDLVVDGARPGTLAHAVRRLLDAAYAVRDQLSNDTWLVVGSLDREILALRGPMHDPQAVVQGALQRVMQSLLALAGLGSESMVRDLGWQFMDAGRRIERSIQLLALLRATVTEGRGTATDSLVFESVLTAAESIITYRRRYRSQAQLETLLDLLLLDPGNPRSVLYQLTRLSDDLDAIPGSGARLREDQRLVLEASTALRLADTSALVANLRSLEAFLARMAGLLEDAAGAVDDTHFVHLRPQTRLVSL
jgi:uncharacterized circularly permuted ATP-grasp superfamily protein/uncharacterized alpha-E superfamily protein